MQTADEKNVQPADHKKSNLSDVRGVGNGVKSMQSRQVHPSDQHHRQPQSSDRKTNAVHEEKAAPGQSQLGVHVTFGGSLMVHAWHEEDGGLGHGSEGGKGDVEYLMNF